MKTGKSKTHWAWYAGGAAVLLLVVPAIVRGAKTALTAESLLFNVNGVNNFNVTGAGLEFDLLVGIRNPSANALNVQGYFLDVKINGSRLGQANYGTNNAPISIPTWREGVFPLRVRLGWVDMGVFLAALVFNFKAFADKPTVTVEVTGQLRVNELTVPVATVKEVPNFIQALRARKQGVQAKTGNPGATAASFLRQPSYAV